MFRSFHLLIIITILALSACVPPAPTLPAASPVQSPTPTISTTPPTTLSTPSPVPLGPPPAIVEMLRQWLAQQLGLTPDQITIQSAEAVDWPDACLGVKLAERVCAEVITPGYQITLAAEGNLYEVHTNQDGSQYYLAAAPPLEIANPLLIWSEMRGGDCMTIQIGQEMAAHGLCGGVLLKSNFTEGTLTETLKHFTQKYAAFEAQTPAGNITFKGHGPITATPWEQRAMAEWARLLYEQAVSGRTGAAWGLALAWQREGGIAGFCDDVTVYLTGEALVSSCKGALAEQTAHIRLTSNQLQWLYSLVDNYQTFEFEHTDPATADAMTIRIVLAGKGQREVEEHERRAISDLAAEILAQALTTPNPQDIQSARQALLDYFDALNARDYPKAVALYGGDYQVLRDMNPLLEPDDYIGLFKNACTINGFVCDLKVRNLVWEIQLSGADFRFTLELENPDGSLFSLGPCCGGSPEEFPPLTQFDFRVKKVEGKFLVQDLPVYIP